MEGDKKNVGAPLPDEALDAVAGGAAAVQDDRVIVEGGNCPFCFETRGGIGEHVGYAGYENGRPTLHQLQCDTCYKTFYNRIYW